MEPTPLSFNIVDLVKPSLPQAETWIARQIAELNGGILEIASVHGNGDFHDHSHDEMFIVFQGGLTMYTKDAEGVITEHIMKPGDGLMLPAGVQHKLTATEQMLVLHYKPVGSTPTYNPVDAYHTHENDNNASHIHI